MKPSCTVTRLTDAAGPRRCSGVQVRRAGQAGRQVGQQAVVAAPEVADGVPELAVPLAPAGGEPADVVAVALADVPRLGDQLHLGEHRVLPDQVEERREASSKPPVLPGQGRREVEPEPVDAHVGHPVPQRVHDQPQAGRVADVQRVAAPRGVDVAPSRSGRAGSRQRCPGRGSTASGPSAPASAVWL